jgi:hypothetical protein
MAGALTPITRWQILDNGVIAPGAKLYTYASGTSTPLAVYNNADLAIGHAHTNPVVADSEGVLPVIFLSPVAYRFLVTDAAGATIFPAQDDITAASLLLPNDSVTYAMLQNVSATQRVLVRKSAGAGDVEEGTLSEVLDFIGSAAQGDLLYRGASTWARLGAGTSGQVLQTLGAGANPAWRTAWLDRDVAVATVTNTTTETAVYSFSVPANTLGTDKKLRLALIGDYLNDSGGSADITFRVKLGATTVLSGTNGNTVATSPTRHPVRLDAGISALNATNAQVAAGLLFFGTNGGVTGALGAPNAFGDSMGVHAGVAEDSTAALTLSVTVQHTVANASITFRCHAVHVELV